MKTIGIVGTRRRDSEEDFELILSKFFEIYEEGDTICSGGCPKGADFFAKGIAFAASIPITIHHPNKADIDPLLCKKNPRAAYAVINYARNTLIARDSDILIACVAPDRKGGTEDTIKKFIKFHGKENLYLV